MDRLWIQSGNHTTSKRGQYLFFWGEYNHGSICTYHTNCVSKSIDHELMKSGSLTTPKHVKVLKTSKIKIYTIEIKLRYTAA